MDLIKRIQNFLEDQSLEKEKAVAVAVSGGPDSMALAWLLHQSLQEDQSLHILTVDHGLRAEAAQEAKAVAQQVEAWPSVQHQILVWDGEKPDKAVQERARDARYELMTQYCEKRGIQYLFLAHHQDDQAETVLFRLAKGSGLDGLCGMQSLQPYHDKLTFVRPLLSVPKQDLIDICEEHSLSYILDPTNDDQHYARPRLRAARDILEKEGLTAKRLSVSAKRFARARKALEQIAEKEYKNCTKNKKTNCIEFNLESLSHQSEEIILRIILKVIQDLGLDKTYAPRMEKVESLCEDLMVEPKNFRKRTLGGVIFAVDQEACRLICKREHNK